MARRGSEPSSLAGHGSGHDILDAAELLLRRRNLGHVMDRVDLGRHCLGYSREKEPAGPAHLQRGSRCLDGRWGEDVEYPALARREGPAAIRSLLFRLVTTSSGGSVVELERTARQVPYHARRCS